MTRRSTRTLRKGVAAIVAAACLLVGLLGGASPAVAAGIPVNGGGSTFAQPEIQQWIADRPNIPVSFAVSSSGEGRDSYAQGALQYAASDIVYYSNDMGNATEAETQHPFKYVTVSAGGLAFMYNIIINGQRFTGLNLTRQEVCQIFTGQLQTWNQLASTPGDAALATVNQRIVPVIRSDAAGESYVFSQYCIAVEPGIWGTFQNFVDSHNQAETGLGWGQDTDMSIGKPVENWPPELSANVTAIQANSATGVVNGVENPNNGFSIGYMAAAYALTARYPMASVQNAAGNFVQPNAVSVQLALSYATFNGETFDLNFTGPAPGAYFPSTYSYIIAPTTTDAPTSAGADATLAQFLCYAIGAGQQDAPRLLYAPLSLQVTGIALGQLNSIPYPGGAAHIPGCGQGGPLPSEVAPGAPPVPPPPGAVPIPTGPTATTLPPTGPAATTAPPTGPVATTAPPTGPAATTTTLAGNAVSQANNSAVAHPTGTSATGATGTGSSASEPCGTTTTAATSTTSSSTTLSTTKKSATTGKKKQAAGRSDRKKSSETRATAPKAGGAMTTSTSAHGTTSTARTTSTTSTTLCAAGTTKAGGVAGAAGSKGTGSAYASSAYAVGPSAGAAVSPTTVQLASAPTSSNTTNSQAYWYLLVGAAVCAVGVGAVEFRRRPAR